VLVRISCIQNTQIRGETIAKVFGKVDTFWMYQPPPTPAPLHPHTRIKSGIVQRHERTDGPVAWIATCLADAQADSTAKPQHYQAPLSIPH
jgi:hypothetical protein